MISAVIKYDDNRVSIHSAKTKQVGTRFEKGFYKAFHDQNGNLVISEEVLPEVHDLYNTKDTKMIVNTVKAFFNPEMEAKITQLGFTHKLGVLLYGKQGCGKTTMLNSIADGLLKNREAVVFLCNSSSTLGGAISLAKMIREIQDTPIVFIADEFERYARDMESEMKTLLDGVDSVQNSLFLAATNYIDKVPDTLKNRPSRFKVVQELKGITDKSLIRSILEDSSNKITPSIFNEQELDEIVNNAVEYTLDELKHIALDKLTNNFLPKVSKPKIGFKKEVEEEDDYSGLDLGEIVWPDYTVDWGTKITKSKPEKTHTNI